MVNCEGRFKISLLSTPFKSNNLESQLISCNRNHLPTHHPHPLFKVNLDKRGYSKILNLKDFIHFETLSLSSYSFIKELDIIEVKLVFSEHKSKLHQQAEQKRNQEKGKTRLEVGRIIPADFYPMAHGAYISTIHSTVPHHAPVLAEVPRGCSGSCNLNPV